MNTSSYIKNHEYLYISIVISLVVSISNLHAVFGLDILLLDDNARYFFFTNDLEITYPRSFIGLGVALKNFVIYLFGTHSAETARGFLLIVYMIPISILFYFFNRKILNLSIWVSLMSATLINIIPRQFGIPAHLDGSYPLPGMLVFIITLISSAYYLNAKNINFILLLLATIAWLLVCDLIAEMSIFLFPVLIFLVLSSNAAIKIKGLILAPTLLITSYRLYLYFETVGINPTNKPTLLHFTDVTGRITKSFEWWLPFGEDSTTVIALGLILATFLIYSFISIHNNSVEKKDIKRAFIFYTIWFFSCCIPFWFMSKYFSARYFYIPFIGLSAIAYIALYEKLILPRRHVHLVSIFTVIIIFSVYGTQRFLLNESQIDRWNRKNTAILTLLSKEIINDETQIALVNIKNGTGGYYMWSSGYLQYALKKPGIRGLMGNEINFYDPFNLNHCGYSYKMSCLDTGKELIAFKQNEKYKTHQMRYFLQWINKGKRNSEWLLYRTDANNNLSVISTGSGLNAYINTLSELELTPEQVLWGNSKDKKSLENLK